MCIFSFQEAASCALCSILSASCTSFAVWMPKKMNGISVSFVRALTRLRSLSSLRLWRNSYASSGNVSALYPHWRHYHGFSILIGATHTPSSRLYAPPTAVRINKNDGAFSSLFWTIFSRSLLRLSAPSLIRSSPLTQEKIWNSQDFQWCLLPPHHLIHNPHITLNNLHHLRAVCIFRFR